MTGTTPEAAAIVLEALGADLIGVDCVAGLEEAIPLLEKMSRVTELPFVRFANAGIPLSREGENDLSPVCRRIMSRRLSDLTAFNIGVIGGCCGTTPEYIRELRSGQGRGWAFQEKFCQQRIRKKGRKTGGQGLSLAGNREYLLPGRPGSGLYNR